jgi:hypothetical protein
VSLDFICILYQKVCTAASDFRFRNYSGLTQYFPRNALFLPPSGEGIARFALEKWMA